MKLKGTRELPTAGVSHREITRDERVKIIALRDEAGMGWAQIGKKLGIDRRTVQKVSIK
jgi:DNA-binding XRE family transcriptional regulator